MPQKIAIILFNLGGPDRQEAVKPFLFNLFHDPAIIRLIQPLRFLIAKLISEKRTPVAQAIYDKIGGGSPILQHTQEQADALEKALNSSMGIQSFKCFISMRYWHPFTEEAATRVQAFAPDKIILLPLYPQFSTTTTASSLKAWGQAVQKIGLTVSTKTICCYPKEAGFIQTLGASIRKSYEEANLYGTPRILFSAHGLPEKIVKAGDPYAWQCKQTAQALVDFINIPTLDTILCYQSRVGPLTWIGPATDDEIRRAGKDKVPVVVVPIAFVSEHSETLVEIDMEYRHLADSLGVPFFACVPTVGAAPEFIAGLADLVRRAMIQEKACAPDLCEWACPKEFSGCPCV